MEHFLKNYFYFLAKSDRLTRFKYVSVISQSPNSFGKNLIYCFVTEKVHKQKQVLLFYYS